MGLLLALISLGFLAPTPALASSISPLEYSTTTAPLIIEAYAVHEGIKAQPLIDTLNCESQFVPDAKGDFSTTTEEYTSFGVAQIHLSAHQNSKEYITKEQAMNPYFAIGWAAHQFKLGNAHIWTCYRLLTADTSD